MTNRTQTQDQTRTSRHQAPIGIANAGQQPGSQAVSDLLFWDVYAVTGSLDRIDAIERQATRTHQSALSVMADMSSVFWS